MTPCHMADDIVPKTRIGDELAKFFDPSFEFLLNFVYDLARVCFVP